MNLYLHSTLVKLSFNVSYALMVSFKMISFKVKNVFFLPKCCQKKIPSKPSCFSKIWWNFLNFTSLKLTLKCKQNEILLEQIIFIPQTQILQKKKKKEKGNSPTGSFFKIESRSYLAQFLCFPVFYFNLFFLSTRRWQPLLILLQLISAL